MPTAPPKVFISYNRADRRWAEWVAWTLEEAGYLAVIQAWDFRPGHNFVLAMQEAAAESSHTVIVLSPSFLAAEYTPKIGGPTVSTVGEEIIEGLRGALEYTRGNTAGCRVHRVRVPDNVDVRGVRDKLRMTQEEFANRFGFSVYSVRNWEQGRRRPEGPARILLTIIDREPEAALRALAS